MSAKTRGSDWFVGRRIILPQMEYRVQRRALGSNVGVT